MGNSQDGLSTHECAKHGVWYAKGTLRTLACIAVYINSPIQIKWLLNLFFYYFLFWRQRETEHERGRGRERGRHTELETGSSLWTISLCVYPPESPFISVYLILCVWAHVMQMLSSRVFFFFNFFLTFIYFWDRERQSMNGGGPEREGDTQNLKQAPG